MNISFYKKVIKHFSRFSCRAILFIFLLFSQVSGNLFGSSLKQLRAPGTINLKLVAVSIPEGLAALESKAGCVINYNKSIFNEGSRVNIDVKDETLTQVLKQMLTGTRVGFKFADEHTVLLYKLPAPVKPGKISGKVLDEKGETLPGASVRIIETGNGTQTSVDGEYILSVAPGTYTLEITYISYQTMRISGVVVTGDKNTPLNISLKPASSALKEVVVTASYRKASVDGLLIRQKNASEISNGISAEQLARTPDKNIGESLKRISGVSTIDNKFVLVRGIGERYNTAMMDGTVLPSTEAQSRNFSFDMIPAGLVDNVVVSKTITPDMNASFGGGLIQINTKDIPNENFISFTAGGAYNDQSTGKDFLSHKRGKYDYFGFDDGRRDFPKGLVHTNSGTTPNVGLSDADYQKKVVDQSKRFTNDNFTMYKYKTAPSQNYQFSIGRLLTLDTINNNKLGFTGALSYRNTQNINIIDDESRGNWGIQRPDLNTGAAYVFNTTLGALLNVGLQLGNNRLSLRNTYTHVYDNTLTRIGGYDRDNGGSYIPIGTPNRVVEADDPTYTTLLQNKLSGQHQLGKVKIEWDAARTGVSRQEKDASVALSRPILVGDSYQYFYIGSKITEPRVSETSRQHASNKETHYSWDVSGTLPFTFAGIRSSIKTGYFGNRKNAEFEWQIAALATTKEFADSSGYKPIGQLISPENIAYDKYIYAIDPSFLDSYKGKSQTHAGYVMLDNRLFDKLRLVWGVRGEYYKYTEIKQGATIRGGLSDVFSVKPDKRWQWLPSANLTYSPIQSLNIRAAFSSSVVRPELMDNTPFLRYSPTLDGLYGNMGLYSTRINSYDFKTEWFPGLGEIISVGGFYKRFDKPAELTAILVNDNPNYYLRSADWAKVYGLELELRKNFGFIADEGILKNLTAYGNVTLQKSTVQSIYFATNPEAGKPNIQVAVQQKRSMYGQSPYLYNAGLQYADNHFGLNAAYNKSGRKTYIVSDGPDFVEYERPREQLDIQISYRFLKNKIEIKFNAANLTNNISTIYRNSASYEKIPGYTGQPGSDRSKGIRLKSGFSNNYEKGDQVMFQQKFGRTYSTSLTYNF